MASTLDEQEIEAEGEEEWMRLLDGYGEKAETAAGEGQQEQSVDVGDDAMVQDPEEMEVADEGGAAALLATVKERLAAEGRSAQYRDFLAAVSKAAVDREAARAALWGHSDLVTAFERCFAAPGGEEELSSAPKEHRGAGARAAQLVQLVFSSALKAGHEHEQTKMLEYVKRKAAQSAFPRRLVLLRGPPGTGKSYWAQRELRHEAGLSSADEGELLAARLTHVCSSDDFFMQFKGASSDMRYVFNGRGLDAAHCTNEARVRLAMELGLEPLYVDNCNMRLWDMRPYILLADRMGYIVSVVSPGEINARWAEVDHLLTRVQEKHARTTEKYAGRAALEAAVQAFEALPDATDPRPSIRAACRPSEDTRLGVSPSEYSTKLPPSALLYKLEKLLKEGSQTLRYTPPDGKGWGVNGELSGEWHSFREKSDGSCTYDDELHWYTEEPESGWSLDELAQLADLREEALQLPQAALPSATSHPALFAKEKRTLSSQASAAKAKAAPAAQASETQAAAKQVSRAGVWQNRPEEAVPASRAERFKHRMKLQQAQEAKEAETFEGAAGMPPLKVAKKAKAKAARAPPAPAADALNVEELAEEQLPGVPTEQEEVSAATFLAAVKARLTEWGKPEQYHAFVLALSGTVDAKAAVRILRGHDDLLRVFKRKFAPEADLMAIKSELKEEDGDTPRPPSFPPRFGGGVKEELGARRMPRAASAPYTPASGPSSLARVKTEAGVRGMVKEELGGRAMVKAELKAEDMPRPPKSVPNAPRGPVTIGDDSDEDIGSEASIAAAVKKGRDECIAQLAKTIFRRERLSHEGARPRLGMVRYATKVASRPRFPREIFILRGCPGVGKTEYAMQQLADYVEVETDSELAARLTHVCAADDFFEQFKSDDAVYKFEASRLESVHCRNEARARLAMEAGIHPLYIDCANLRLWEMQPYVLLAERLGYVITVVEPQDICEKWDDVAFLASANDTGDRRKCGKVVQKAALAAMVKAFEPLGLDDPIKAIKAAQRSEGPRMLEAVPLPPETKPSAKAHAHQASWMKVKEEAWEKAASGQRQQKRPAQPASVPSSAAGTATKGGRPGSGQKGAGHGGKAGW